MKRILQMGLVSGLAAGVAMAGFMLAFARGPLNAALEYEEQVAHAEGTAHTHDELFSRGVQEIGGVLGVVLFGVALGVIFSIVLFALGPRLGAVSPMHGALRLGAAGFFVVVVVPFLKYPANPPGVGDPDTVNERTVLYFSVLVLSLLLAYTVLRTVEGSQLSSIGKTWLGLGCYVGGLGVIYLVLPSTSDPVLAPADIVWDFRLTSLGGLATAWCVMAATMGTMLTRYVAATSDDPAAESVVEPQLR